MRVARGCLLAKTVLLLGVVVLVSLGDARFVNTPGKGHRPAKRHAGITHFHTMDVKLHTHSVLKRFVTDSSSQEEMDDFGDKAERRKVKEPMANGTVIDDQSAVNVKDRQDKSLSFKEPTTVQKATLSKDGTESSLGEEGALSPSVVDGGADNIGKQFHAAANDGNWDQQKSTVDTSTADVLTESKREKVRSDDVATRQSLKGKQTPDQAVNMSSKDPLDGQNESKGSSLQPQSDENSRDSTRGLNSQGDEQKKNATAESSERSQQSSDEKSSRVVPPSQVDSGHGALQASPTDDGKQAGSNTKLTKDDEHERAMADKAIKSSNGTDVPTRTVQNGAKDAYDVKGIKLSSTRTPNPSSDLMDGQANSSNGPDPESATTHRNQTLYHGDAAPTPPQSSSAQSIDSGKTDSIGMSRNGDGGVANSSDQPLDGQEMKGSSGNVYGSSHSFQDSGDGGKAMDIGDNNVTAKETQPSPKNEGEATDGGEDGGHRSSSSKGTPKEAPNAPIYPTSSHSDVSNSTVPANVSHWSSDSESDDGSSGNGSDVSSPAASVYSDQSSLSASSDPPPSSSSSSSQGSSIPDAASDHLSQGSSISNKDIIPSSPSNALPGDPTFNGASSTFGQAQGQGSATSASGDKSMSDVGSENKAFGYANHQKLLLPGYDGNDDGNSEPPSPGQAASPNKTDASTIASHHIEGAKQQSTPAAQATLLLNIPSVIAPRGGATEQPPDTICVSILFRSSLGWTALASSPDLVAQIFLFMPSIIAESVNLDAENVTTVRLERQASSANHLSRRDGTPSNGSTWQSLYIADVPASVGSTLQDKIKDPQSAFYLQPVNPVAKALAVQVDPSHDILQISTAPSTYKPSPGQAKDDNGASGLKKALIVVGCILIACILAFVAQYVFKVIKGKRESRMEGARLGNNRRYRDTIQTFGSSAQGQLRETWAPSEHEQQRVLNGHLLEMWRHSDSPQHAQDGLLTMGHYVPEMAHASDGAVSMRSAREVVDPFVEALANRSSQETERSGGSAEVGQRNTLLSHLNYPTEDSSIYSDASRLTDSQRIQQEYTDGREHSVKSAERSHETFTTVGAMTHNEVYERPAQYTSSHAHKPACSPKKRHLSKSSIGGTIGRPQMQRNSVLL